MIIKAQRLQCEILAALTDTDLQKILNAAMYQSKSATEIAKETENNILLFIERLDG